MDAQLSLIERIHEKYGYDFREYYPDTLKRRISWRMQIERIEDMPTFQDKILSDPNFFATVISDFSINVTSMFRDPNFFSAIREEIVPVLATYPHIRIWSAGCATGEEAYSLAIMLKEEGLYERSLIYATDFSLFNIREASEGKYPLKSVAEFAKNYYAAGGTKQFHDYFSANSSYATFDPELRKRIVFSTHNLVSDGVFNEFHMIFCRNVLIYFNENLVDKVLKLFHDSLVLNGILCLGMRESLLSYGARKYFVEANSDVKTFKRAGCHSFDSTLF